MESLTLSQKSMADVKDPVIKQLVKDITTIMQAEMVQQIDGAKQQATTKAGKAAANSRFADVEAAYRQMSADEKSRLHKMRRKLDNAEFRKQAVKLGIDAKSDTPASKQVDIAQKFAHLKGQGKAIVQKLDAMSSNTVVPFTQFPDQETTQLIDRIKKSEKDADKYADYLRLLDKDKLIKLYEREKGTIQNRSAFFETHEPDATEITKIRRTVAEWQKRGGGSPTRYRNRYLKLIVTRVRCVDETEHEGVWPFEGEGIANDRIDLGAIGVGPNFRTRQFGPQMVSDNFEDNREFPWNREVARFTIPTTNSGYPLEYGVTLTIAEIDYGAGFANTLNEIWGKIRSVIVEVVTKIGEAIGTYLGSGEAGKFIGKIVGELIALGLGELVAIAGRAVQDDVFNPQVALISLDSPYSTFSGVIDKLSGPFRSPEQELRFDGFGGSYRVYFVWELERVREDVVTPIVVGRHLKVFTKTGGDDLRGYNTAFFTVNYTNGTSSREYLLHRGHGGGQESSQTFELDSEVALDSIQSITIRHDGSPQWVDSYDNWNLDQLNIKLLQASGAETQVFNGNGAPLHRFTGASRTFMANRS